MIIRRMAVVAVLSLVAFVTVAQARDVPAALRPYMTAEEFRAAGLHKLNPAELAQFQAWFVRTVGERPARAETPGPAPQAAEQATRRANTQAEPARPAERIDAGVDRDDPRLFGLERMEGRASGITAVAQGTYEGWESGTTFELDNGQVWEVYDTARYRFLRPLVNPEVSIERGAFDTYRLKVEGYNRWANVRRTR